jgi:hypothetical protein
MINDYWDKQKDFHAWYHQVAFSDSVYNRKFHTLLQRLLMASSEHFQVPCVRRAVLPYVPRKFFWLTLIQDNGGANFVGTRMVKHEMVIYGHSG